MGDNIIGWKKISLLFLLPYIIDKEYGPFEKSVNIINSKHRLFPITPVQFLDFRDFCKYPAIPNYHNCKQKLKTFEQIDRSCSIIVYISHCWFRNYYHSNNNNNIIDDDNNNNNNNSDEDNSYYIKDCFDKNNLFVKGIELLISKFAPGIVVVIITIIL